MKRQNMFTSHFFARQSRVCMWQNVLFSWLKPLRVATKGKIFLKKPYFKLGLDLKKDRNKAGIKNSITQLYYKMMVPSSLAFNRMHLHP